jgi:hypothetical protein
MTPSEVATLLAKCAAYDRRTIGEADVAAWHDALHDVSFADASAAVTEHYVRSSVWIGVAEVRAGVKRIRAGRLARVDVGPPPDVDPDDVPAYLDAYRAQRRAVADGGEPGVVRALRSRDVGPLLRRVGRGVPGGDGAA